MRIANNLILYLFLWWNRGKAPPRLKQWIDLEAQKEKIVQAVENEADFPSELVGFISTAWGIRPQWIEKANWALLVRAFYFILSSFPNVSLPITIPSGEKSKEESWDYPTRTWHLYAHLLAKAYGWTLEYISCLQVADALAKIQEIIVEDQLDKEFMYSLSEIAYAYDKNTKTSKFVPLSRPHWMRTKIQPVKKFIIPKSILPMGNVITDGVLPPEFMPKEVIR